MGPSSWLIGVNEEAPPHASHRRQASQSRLPGTCVMLFVYRSVFLDLAAFRFSLLDKLVHDLVDLLFICRGVAVEREANDALVIQHIARRVGRHLPLAGDPIARPFAVPPGAPVQLLTLGDT